ncbi:MAG: hypothetical protein IIC76_02405 [Bacteroidetes bacterium]|nr:hypothetical protein [Bacteroidota bacterium]
MNFTCNTAYKSWQVNLYINAGCSIQTLYDFGPQTPNTRYYNFLLLFPTGIVITEDFRGESTAGFINFTSGIYFNIGENSGVRLGARFYFETQLKDPSTSTFVLPMFRVDIRL